MNKENKQTTSGGIGLANTILVVFIILKLCGVISWSWLWVLSPIWIPLAVAIVIFLIILWISAVTALFTRIKS